MVKNIIFLLVLLLITACSASVTRSRGPHGEEIFIIDCGSNVTLYPEHATCVAEAGKLCGKRGYTVLDAREDSGSYAVWNKNGGHAATTHSEMMAITCD